MIEKMLAEESGKNNDIHSHSSEKSPRFEKESVEGARKHGAWDNY
jgi:hypothetical protein